MGMSSTNPIGSPVTSFNLGGGGGGHTNHTSAHGGSSAAGGNVQLREDTLGGELKTGVAQIIACVLARDTVSNCKQFVPWLFSPPSTTQQGLVEDKFQKAFREVWKSTDILFIFFGTLGIIINVNSGSKIENSWFDSIFNKPETTEFGLASTVRRIRLCSGESHLSSHGLLSNWNRSYSD